MSVATAFLKRDFSLSLSYRLSFFTQIFGIVFSVASFYFLSRLFGSAMVPQLNQYGGDYFSFVLIGLAFTGYLSLSITSFAQSIREGQMMGTLEIMLLSPTRLSSILLSSSLWAYLLTTFNVVTYFIVGILIFGFSIGQANFLTAIVVLLLSIVSFSGVGIISAAVILLVKKGDPITAIYGSLSGLLAGVFYPVAVLPDWLEPLSRVLPMTYALDSMRLAMLKGYTLYQVRFDLLVLVCFALVLTPFSFFVFRKALKRAKMEGSLIHY
ncbi:MAG: ABC transporter [Chloroflexi bacterium RBG_16_56_11]|nr:MAG: ABC transporter [Chloroflexi bacterium RBG_16_56_11]